MMIVQGKLGHQRRRVQAARAHCKILIEEALTDMRLTSWRAYCQIKLGKAGEDVDMWVFLLGAHPYTFNVSLLISGLFQAGGLGSRT